MYQGIFQSVENNRGWIYAFGILLFIMGFFALTFVGLTTIASVIYLGALFMVEGAGEVYLGLQNRKKDGMGSHLIFGILYMVGGFLIIRSPVGNAVFLTTLIVLLMLVSGFVALVSNLFERGSNWVWFSIMGLVSIVLAISLLQTPILSSVWLIGTFVGIDMLFKGSSLIALAWTSGRGNKAAAQ